MDIVGDKHALIISNMHQAIVNIYIYIKNFGNKEEYKGKKGKENALYLLIAIAYGRLDVMLYKGLF